MFIETSIDMGVGSNVAKSFLKKFLIENKLYDLNEFFYMYPGKIIFLRFVVMNVAG